MSSVEIIVLCINSNSNSDNLNNLLREFYEIWYHLKYWNRPRTHKTLFGMTITHWSRVTHICVSKLTIIGSDNGSSPDRRRAIIWTNAGILLIGPLGTNFSEILIEIHAFSFKKMNLKMSSGKWRPFWLGLNVIISLDNKSNGPSLLGYSRQVLSVYLTHWGHVTHICVSNQSHHWWPSHYPNQCWNIVNWTHGNKLQWNLNRNSYTFM